MQTVKAVFASTKGSHSVVTRRRQNRPSAAGSPVMWKKYPLSIKNSAMWNR